MKNFLAWILGAGSRLSDLEKLVLGCVREQLPEPVAILWDKQIAAINKVQRLPRGVEVNLYSMKNGRPSFDPALAFPNRTTELKIAKVQIKALDIAEITADVWSVEGFVFLIRYKGVVDDFEEAAGMDPPLPLVLSCILTADLATDVRL